MNQYWTPHLTVAAIIEQEGRFLVVEEEPDGVVVLNQPAGHVEKGEGFVDAVIREVREETTRAFTPTAIGGIYRWYHQPRDLTYIRIAVIGECGAPDPALPLDSDIITTHWLTREQLHNHPIKLRSSMVLRCIDDYLAQRRWPLDLLTELDVSP